MTALPIFMWSDSANTVWGCECPTEKPREVGTLVITKARAPVKSGFFKRGCPGPEAEIEFLTVTPLDGGAPVPCYRLIVKGTVYNICPNG